MNMKIDKSSIRCLLILVIGMVVVACSQNDISKNLQVAEDIIDEHPDSTLKILDQIEYQSLNGNRAKALYGLLYTSAAYKCWQTLDNDSLIDYSISIFKEKDDDYHLADAYYYKGAMNYARNQPSISIGYLKNAESLAVSGNYHRIANKVYELLSYVNYSAGNKDLTLQYTKKFLDNSTKLDDKAQIVRALIMVASSYAALNMPDSAYFYITHGQLYIHDADSSLKADLLVNLGEMYYEKADFASSRKLAKESDSIFPNPHAKMLLGKIAYKAGEEAKALNYWEEAEALTIDDMKLKRQLYRRLSDYYAKTGQYEEAYAMAARLDSLNKADNITSAKTQELQLKFDRARAEAELYQKLTYSLVTAFLVSIMLIALLRYHKKEVKSYHNKIGLYVSKVAKYEDEISNNIEKIKELKSADRAKQKEIDALQGDIATLYQSIITELRKGNEIYEAIRNKKPIVQYTDEDLGSLVDFYKIVKNDVFSDWMVKYQSLSVRQYLFLMLEELGFDDNGISEVLGVSAPTIRSTRFRIKKKARS